MNRIITTSVLDPSIQQPFTAKSLDFLQDSVSAMLYALGQSIVGTKFSASTAYILKGLEAYGTNQYNEGYLFFFGEIYYCPGKATITAFVNVPVLTITVANDVTADPVTFSDLVPRNVHNVRTLVMSDAVTGSGTFDLSAAVYINNTEWIANDANTSYRKDGRTVFLFGRAGSGGTSMGNASTSFTLPVGFRPSIQQVIKGVILHDTATDAASTNVTINTDGTIYCSSLTGAGTARWISLTGISFNL